MNTFHKEANTKTRIFGKRDFQRVLKDLKAQGATVDKNDMCGYDVLYNDVLIMQAMNGNNSYLVRLDTNVLS
jgi:hypothetical protein